MDATIRNLYKPFSREDDLIKVEEVEDDVRVLFQGIRSPSSPSSDEIVWFFVCGKSGLIYACENVCVLNVR